MYQAVTVKGSFGQPNCVFSPLRAQPMPMALGRKYAIYGS